jgi:hypothetical protein
VAGADPDAYFAELGFDLPCYEADGFWWADLFRLGNDRPVPRYGRGDSPDDAKASALRRWIVEQEPG